MKSTPLPPNDHMPHSNEGQRDVAHMFGRIARRYDFLNHTLSLGIDRWWRSRLVALSKSGPTGRILDLAAGTLDVSLALQRRHPHSRILSFDFSLPMLEYGRAKLQKRATDARGIGGIYPVAADALALPLPDASVDCVTIAFGIRNIQPRVAAFAEMHRVLVPGGRVCVLEFGGNPPRIWKGLYSFYLTRLLPGIGALISGDKAYHYLAKTITEFPDAESLSTELTTAGFERGFHLPLTSGIVNIHIADKAAQPSTTCRP